MENIQQAVKSSAMMNEAPMNHLTLSDRLKSYKGHQVLFLLCCSSFYLQLQQLQHLYF